MKNQLHPYPEYKDSGLSWLGRIPSHWNLRRAKYFYREVNERSQTGREELCSVSHKTGVTPRKGNVTMFMAESTVGYKIVRPDDLAINTLWAWMAALGIARQVGLVSPAYGVYRPLPDSELIPNFAEKLLRIQEYKTEYTARSTGINASRLRLYPDQFLRIPILLPPYNEQVIISRYLDNKDQRIRRFIRNRRRLIEVLKELKQAIINQAVTHGLDPGVPTKPSENDILGDIPAHWEARSLRSIGRFMKGFGGSKEDDINQGIPCIRYGHLYMYFDYTVPSARTFIDETRAADYGRSRYGDLLFTASGEDIAEIGKSATNLIEGDVCCGGDVIILRPRITTDARFLGYASHAWHAAFQKSRLGRGTTIKHIYEDQLKKVWIALPPIDEQIAITNHIEKMTADIETLSVRAHDEIRLIQEYRTRLVSDVVTGKIDVRGLTSAKDPFLEDDIGPDDYEGSDAFETEDSDILEEAIDDNE